MANEKNISLDNLKTFKKKADATYAKKTDIVAANNGKLTIQKNGSTVATFTANQSGNATANITVPTKLNELSERTFGNLTNRGEEYLEWGGPAKSGSVSPIGVAMSLEHSANRLAFINPDALTFEYSSDGGTTWTAYSYKGTEKTRFCTSYLGLPIGRPDESTNLVANKSKTRITITGQTGTAGYVYTSLRKLLVNVSSATTLSMLLERRTGANYKSNGAWETIGTYNLTGWSGWNDIPLSSHLGGGNTQTSNYWQMRMTITCTTVSTSNPKVGQVRGIRIFGENCWIPASTLAETGHLYSYNMAGHATFPGNVYANGFYANGTISTTNGSVSGLSFIEGGKKLSDKYLAKGYLERISPKLFRHTIKIEGYSERTTGTALVCMLQVDSSFSRAVDSFEGLATVLGSINKETGEPGIQSSCMVSGGIVVGSGDLDYILPLIRLETDGILSHTVFVSLINEYPDLSEDVDSRYGHLSDYSTVTYTDSVTPVS